MRFIIVLLLGVLTFSLTALADTHTPKNTTRQSRLSEELLRLTLQVMLYSGDLKNASMIVKQGAKQFPNDPWWNEKAAEISLWNGNSSDALNYYLKFYTIQPTVKTRGILYNLASQLQNQEVSLEMLKEEIRSGDEKNVSKLANMYQNIGNLSEGAKFFDSLYQKNKKQQTLKAKISLLLLDQQMGEAEEDYRLYSEKYGVDPAIDMEIAKVAFSQKKLDKAYFHLHRHHLTMPSDREEYWHFYIDILWLQRSFDELYTVLLQRYHEGLMRPFDRDRLELLALSHDKNFASELALESFDKELKTGSFFTFVFLAKEEKAFDRVESVIDQLDGPQRERLEKMAEFWILKAEIATRHAQWDRASALYQKAIRINPDNVAVNVAYGWFLLDQNRIDLLKKWLIRIEKKEKHSSIEYALLRTSAHLRMQESAKAKGHLERLLRAHPNDASLYVLYSDVLNLWSDQPLAQKYLRRAWLQMDREAKKHPEMKKNPDFLATYLRLGMTFEPQKRKLWKKEGSQGLSAEANNNFLLGVAILDSNDEAIEYARKKVRKSEPWLDLYMAFSQNDVDQMSHTVLSNYDELPISDRVQAAYQSGNRDLAFTLGYEGLDKNPNNDELYRLMHRYWMDDYSKIKIEISELHRSPLTYQEAALTLNQPLVKGFNAQLAIRHRDQKSDDAENLPTLSAEDQQVSFKLTKEGTSTDLALLLGYRNTMQSFWTGQIDGVFRFSAFTFNLHYNYHTDAEESVYLSLEGYKNSINFGMGYSLSKTLELSTEMKQNDYHGSDGEKVGNGDEITMMLTKRLRDGYPDLGIHSSIGYYGYREKEPSWHLQTILPSTGAALLPADYYQITLGMFYGLQTREHFEKKWRPYMNIDVAHSSQNAIGYSAMGGIGGALFGEDRLSLEANYSSDFSNFDKNYYKVSLLYFLYGW